jgi:hypothetical protein
LFLNVEFLERKMLFTDPRPLARQQHNSRVTKLPESTRRKQAIDGSQ